MMTKTTTTVGFEPTRALHNRFQVCLLDRSDKLPINFAVIHLFVLLLESNQPFRVMTDMIPLH